MKTYNIVIASDHSGYELKSKIINYLEQKCLNIYDCGTQDTQTVDYPDYAKKVVDIIIEKAAPIGILISDTGIGMSIAANRSSEIRAALCNDILTAENAKAHNDANILILGAKSVDNKIVFNIIDKFLTTKFEGGRHSTRLSKIK
ncbi:MULTISPECIES: ribose 5-phosphate isomerase B [typhus group]|uniref:Putative sugar phosphate isomerase RP299 n=4 Tax=typhus group TaxID=114292 RepID=Y299_RICPR|nr:MULTISPECIES: ribose 5-phosphate isomerase B [typhus group]Q68X72.1 RecName: Full=Putative sugar phosphate isomerase RT0290 [Rickettsia typhi str. Wilmington]Q9ZDM8.1 RecName: Full=Putative sugar phosphate isomerase RP299 [Rickettsia prowazekii str. Madrid E]EOB09655.1 DNA mismatch repair protein MutS [Rickettsia prowazekii str. GvF12]AAU03770.1 5-phosphoribose isomerase [Rickettsia typhi str. Wilmington]ADE29813.1 Ribose-5-phosphate isomerase [Rickettsia prowazekii str. Rp22]AFE49116.1 ri